MSILDQRLRDSITLEDKKAELAVASVPSAITPMTVLQMAIAQGGNIDQLTKLMELQERWEANEARKAFYASFSEFQKFMSRPSSQQHQERNLVYVAVTRARRELTFVESKAIMDKEAQK